MRKPIFFGIGLAVFLSNCTASLPTVSQKEVEQSGTDRFYLDPNLDQIPLSEVLELESSATREEPLTLEQAVIRTLLYNPALQIHPFDIRTQEALAIQEGLYPNPTLELEVEDAAGSGDFDFGNNAEITTLYSQLIERGGKRQKRYAAGLWKTETAKWDYRIAKVDTLSELAIRYIDVLSAQEQVEVLRDLVSISEEALFAVSERVRTGRVSPIQESQAKVELAVEQNALIRAEQEWLAAKELLQAMWDNRFPIAKVSGSFREMPELPNREALLTDLEANPEIERWEIEKKRRQSLLELERAQAVPDITLTGGVRYLDETEDGTLQLGASIPLMLFNRNQGGIRAAQEQVNKTEQEKKAQWNDIRSQLLHQYNIITATQQEVSRLAQVILPQSEQTYHAAREGYQQGKFDYLQVLDAQRTYFQSQIRYLQALTSFHHQWITIERLTGKPLQSITTSILSGSESHEAQ